MITSSLPYANFAPRNPFKALIALAGYYFAYICEYQIVLVCQLPSGEQLMH